METPKYRVGMLLTVGLFPAEPTSKAIGHVISWDDETLCVVDDDRDVVFLTHDEAVRLNPGLGPQ